MASWSDFAAAEPRLAAAVHALVHQYGPGLGYLATVRSDGGPRVHPVSPLITDDGLYCFVINSPKRCDLDRDGRYALHSFPAENTDDEAYLAGTARQVHDPARVGKLARELRAEPRVDWRLYEFSVEVAMVVRHREPPTGEGDPGRVTRLRWRDPAMRTRGVDARGEGCAPGSGSR